MTSGDDQPRPSRRRPARRGGRRRGLRRAVGVGRSGVRGSVGLAVHPGRGLARRGHSLVHPAIADAGPGARRRNVADRREDAVASRRERRRRPRRQDLPRRRPRPQGQHAHDVRGIRHGDRDVVDAPAFAGAARPLRIRGSQRQDLPVWRERLLHRQDRERALVLRPGCREVGRARADARRALATRDGRCRRQALRHRRRRPRARPPVALGLRPGDRQWRQGHPRHADRARAPVGRRGRRQALRDRRAEGLELRGERGLRPSDERLDDVSPTLPTRAAGWR